MRAFALTVTDEEVLAEIQEMILELDAASARWGMTMRMLHNVDPRDKALTRQAGEHRHSATVLQNNNYSW